MVTRKAPSDPAIAEKAVSHTIKDQAFKRALHFLGAW